MSVWNMFVYFDKLKISNRNSNIIKTEMIISNSKNDSHDSMSSGGEGMIPRRRRDDPANFVNFSLYRLPWTSLKQFSDIIRINCEKLYLVWHFIKILIKAKNLQKHFPRGETTVLK